MAVIEEGTQFIGVSANVPIPENKSSQNNSFQEVYTIEDISENAKYGEIEDFFVFTQYDQNIVVLNLLFKKTKEQVNGKPEWAAEDNYTYFIRINGDQTIWKLYQDDNDIASIDDDPSLYKYPPSGNWDFNGDLYPVTISYVSGSIQQAIEQISLIAFIK